MILAGESKLPYGQVPIMLHNGEVTLQTSSGKVATVILDTHNFDEKLQDQSSEEVRKKIPCLLFVHFVTSDIADL